MLRLSGGGDESGGLTRRTQASATPANCPRPAAWWRSVRIACAHACVGACCRTAAVLVTVLTYPTVPGLGTMGRLDTGDGRFSIWNVGWIHHALTTSPAHLLDANIFYPHTGTLAYRSSISWPGAGAAGVHCHQERACRAQLRGHRRVRAGVLCMWAFVRRITGSDGAGVVAATAFTFCPFVQSHTPHIQLLMTFGFRSAFWRSIVCARCQGCAAASSSARRSR